MKRKGERRKCWIAIYSKNWSPDFKIRPLLRALLLLGPNREMDPVSPYSTICWLKYVTSDNFTSSWNKVYTCLYPYQAQWAVLWDCGQKSALGIFPLSYKGQKLLRSAPYRPWSTFPTNMTGMSNGDYFSQSVKGIREHISDLRKSEGQNRTQSHPHRTLS